MISSVSFAVGVCFLLATLAGVFLAAAGVVRAVRPDLTGAPRFLAWSVVATMGLILACVLPGALGILSRISVLVAAILELGGAALLIRASPSEAPSGTPAFPPPEPSPHGPDLISWPIAILATAIFGALALAQFRTIAPVIPIDTDALSFHLPGIVGWIQSGSIWDYSQYVPLQSQAAYPNNGDVILLALTLPFRSVVLVRWAMPLFLGLTAVAGYASAREMRAPASTAVLSGVALVAIPAAVLPALMNVQTDSVLLATFTTGIYFLLRHRRTRSRSDLGFAGLALGLAFGTKWYGVSSVPVVVVVWALAWLIAKRRPRRVATDTLVLVGLVAVAGGFWLLRNLIDTGNPVYPVNVAPLGITVFGAPPDLIRQLAGFSIADYLGSPHILGQYVAPALWHTLGLTGALFGVVVLAALLASVHATGRASMGDQWGTALALSICVGLLAIEYIVTPYTALGGRNKPLQVAANTRYLMPALILAAPLTAWAATRLGRFRTLLELGMLGGVVLAARRSFTLHVSGTIALLGLMIVAAAVLRRRIFRASRSQRVQAGALAVIAPIVIVLAVWQRHRFSDQPYRSDPVLAWILNHAPAHNRIGLAATWPNDLVPVFPAFGPRFNNQVIYIGHEIGHTPYEYSRPAGFRAALQRDRVRLLIVGRGSHPYGTVRENSWARSAGYHEIVQSPRLTLFSAP